MKKRDLSDTSMDSSTSEAEWLADNYYSLNDSTLDDLPTDAEVVKMR